MIKDRKPLFSVIICTYNRAKFLKICLESLIKQSLTDTGYEIIVMDDGSSDGTFEQILSFSKKYRQPRVSVYFSQNMGLAHSRNMAVKKAKGKYLAYIDDDAKADIYWLENARNCLQKTKPQPVGITGPVIPFYNGKKSYWFKDSYEEDIKGKTSRFLNTGETISGPNMILKKELIIKYGGFAENIGMKGQLISVGEETKLFENIWKKNAGANILYYASDIKVFHYVHHYKMSVVYKLKRWFAAGQSYYLRNIGLSYFHNFILILKVMGYLFFSTALAIISIVTYSFYQNWMIERIGPLCFIAGFFSGLFKIRVVISSNLRT